jgi:hypothetical protein
MTKLHIANTQFEWEISEGMNVPIVEGIEQHPVFMQLQFLPLLYAAKEDGVAVTALPDAKYLERLKSQGIQLPRLHLLSTKEVLAYSTLEDWGASPAIATWSKAHQLPYLRPTKECVREVNSKQFSFMHGDKLPGSTLLHSTQETIQWIHLHPGPKVLKTCFGMSGKGHLVIDGEHSVSEEKLTRFLEKEWQAQRPILAEPWVKRTLDFSTQWIITPEKKIEYLGPTLCENDSHGRHLGNRVGNPETLFGKALPFLEEHKRKVLEILPLMAMLGYFGHVGIDAMVYTLPSTHNTLHLQPIVEINARKTMGWVALALQALHFPDRELMLSYLSSKEEGFLPQTLQRKNSQTAFFTRQLIAVHDNKRLSLS